MLKENLLKEFKETKFAKSGGSCWECCEYEEMYEELKSFIQKAISETRQNTLKEVEATTKEMAKMIEKVYMQFDREDFCEEPNSVCPGCNGCKTYEELSKLFIKLHKKSLVR